MFMPKLMQINHIDLIMRNAEKAAGYTQASGTFHSTAISGNMMQKKDRTMSGLC